MSLLPDNKKEAELSAEFWESLYKTIDRLHDDAIAQRDEARRWARRMMAERDEQAKELYDAEQLMVYASQRTIELYAEIDKLKGKLRAAMYVLGHSVTGIDKPKDAPRNVVADDLAEILRWTQDENAALRRELEAMRRDAPGREKA